jgi:hypothetical protein
LFQVPLNSFPSSSRIIASFLERLTPVNNYFRKQPAKNRKLECTKNNHTIYRFSGPTFNFTLDMPFWAHLLLTIVMGIGMAELE